MFPNSRLVSSGETQIDVREEPNRAVVIQKNTTETTTENLATPLRSDDLENARENMKALGNTSILDSLKSNMTKKKIGTKCRESKKSVLF
jgi:hypothetical protein